MGWYIFTFLCGIWIGISLGIFYILLVLIRRSDKKNERKMPEQSSTPPDAGLFF